MDIENKKEKCFIVKLARYLAELLAPSPSLCWCALGNFFRSHHHSVAARSGDSFRLTQIFSFHRHCDGTPTEAVQLSLCASRIFYKWDQIWFLPFLLFLYDSPSMNYNYKWTKTLSFVFLFFNRKVGFWIFSVIFKLIVGS